MQNPQSARTTSLELGGAACDFCWWKLLSSDIMGLIDLLFWPGRLGNVAPPR